MGTNLTPLGIRYPDGNEAPALDILLGHLAQDVDTLLNRAWTPYAPLLYGSSVDPVLGGAGVIRASYCKLGRMVDVRATVQWAAGANPGAGAYTLSLPVACAWTWGDQIGTATLVDSDTRNHTATARLAASGTFAYFVADAATADVGAAIPFAWAAGDVLTMQLRYEATS